MISTPETDKCVKENKHIKGIQESFYVNENAITLENPIVSLCRRLERERDGARKEIENIRKILSESGEAVGNGVHNYSIIEMIQNLVKSKSYFIRKSYAEFFKPTVDEEGAK
jgi:hypothetical protein